MVRGALSLGVPLLLSMLAGPVAYGMTNLSQTDPAELYLVIGSSPDLTALLAQDAIQEIGPYSAPLARLIQVPDAVHVDLVETHHWLFPAGALAAICGVAPTLIGP